MQTIYPWSRFWCPQGKPITLDFNGSFLSDPEDFLGRHSNAHLIATDNLAREECLVLLGDPGSGKSYELARLVESERRNLTLGEKLHVLDLATVGGDSGLVRALHDEPELKQWQAGAERLTLAIDSVDEAQLFLGNIGKVLARWLASLPHDRLRLRIACRGTEWPSSLDACIRERWGDRAKTLELAPLRARDVREAATLSRLDVDAFMEAISTSSVQPLATHPVTLRFLLSTWLQSNKLPDTRGELYERGCAILAEGRIGSPERPAGSWSVSQLLEIAGRIAAGTLVCGKEGVFVGLEDGPTPAGLATVSELAGGTEVVRSAPFEVSESALRSTLRTALFTLRTQESVGWAHKTYGEFLAGRYLATRLEPVQAAALLLHPDDTTRVIPQLHAVAAWCAVKIPDVFEAIVRSDPLVLLQGDASALRDDQRAALVEHLLAKVADGQGDDSDWGLRTTYATLRHPGLAIQLRRYVGDRAANPIVRRMAIDIAEACQCSAVINDLVAVALCSEDNDYTREQAAEAVRKIGDGAARERLRPLLSPSTVQEELFGIALSALWPDRMTPEELFGILPVTESRGSTRINIGGGYWRFLDELSGSLRENYLPAGLAWVEGLQDDDGLERYGNLAQALVRAGWKHIDLPDVYPAFVRLIRARIERHESLVGDPRSDEESPFVLSDAMRRLLVEGLLKLATPLKYESSRLANGNPPLILEVDIPWLLEHCVSTSASQGRWIDLVVFMFKRSENAEVIDDVLRAAMTNPELRAALGTYWSGVDLESVEAREMRQEVATEQAYRDEASRRRESAPRKRSPEERLMSLLAQESDRAVWPQVAHTLGLALRPAMEGGEFQSELWIAVSDATRARVLACAEAYLEWLEESGPGDREAAHTRDWPACAALRLLALRNSSWLSARSDRAWAAWTRALVERFDDQAGRPDRWLLGEAIRRNPEAVHEALIEAVSAASANGIVDIVLRAIRASWSHSVEVRLFDILASYRLPQRAEAELAGTMMDCGSLRAWEHVKSIVVTPTSRVRRAIELGRVLLERVDSTTWGELHSALCHLPFLGRAIIRAYARRAHGDSLGHLEKLEPHQLAECYLLAIPQSRKSQGRPQGRAARSGMRHWSFDRMCSQIVQRLVRLGTSESVVAIETLRRERPDRVILPFLVHDAKSTLLERQWRPPTPLALLALVRDRRLRLVESGDQLLDVVIEALTGYQRWLHATPTPGVRFLWDRQASAKGKVVRDEEKYRPLDENELSDFLKLHLDRALGDRGVIANREVEIRRGYGSSKGQRTDVLVQATTRPGLRDDGRMAVVSVVIETKGCWNTELDTALETQLRDQYLREHGAQHGVYLVGWFPCDAWDVSDPRRANVPKVDISTLRAGFDQQALKASGQGVQIRAVVLDARLG